MGKAALVTGSSRGIGKAVILELANSGYRCVVNYNKSEKEAFEVRELAFQIWQLICKYNMRAEFLECVESDISSGNNSADDLVMKLAKFEIDEILKTADMEFT